MAEKKRGSGTKKFGRNSAKCARYESENRLFRNKVSRLVRRFKNYSTDNVLNGIQDKIMRNSIKLKLVKTGG